MEFEEASLNVRARLRERGLNELLSDYGLDTEYIKRIARGMDLDISAEMAPGWAGACFIHGLLTGMQMKLDERESS